MTTLLPHAFTVMLIMQNSLFADNLPSRKSSRVCASLPCSNEREEAPQDSSSAVDQGRQEQDEEDKARFVFDHFGSAIYSSVYRVQYGDGSLDFDSRKVPNFGEEDIELLQHVEGLVNVRLFGDTIDDKTISLLAASQPPGLRAVLISGHNLSDTSIASLRRIPRLEKLHITSDGISDKGLKEISKLQNLTDLVVKSKNITGKGLPFLSKLRDLRHVSLHSENITLEDAKRLFLKLPKVDHFQSPSIYKGDPSYFMYFENAPTQGERITGGDEEESSK